MTVLEAAAQAYWRASCVIAGRPTGHPPDYQQAVSLIADLSGIRFERLRDLAERRRAAIDPSRTLVAFQPDGAA